MDITFENPPGPWGTLCDLVSLNRRVGSYTMQRAMQRRHMPRVAPWRSRYMTLGGNIAALSAGLITRISYRHDIVKNRFDTNVASSPSSLRSRATLGITIKNQTCRLLPARKSLSDLDTMQSKHFSMSFEMLSGIHSWPLQATHSHGYFAPQDFISLNLHGKPSCHNYPDVLCLRRVCKSRYHPYGLSATCLYIGAYSQGLLRKMV